MPPWPYHTGYRNWTLHQARIDHRRLDSRCARPKADIGLLDWPGRNGLIRRTLVTPRNPRSGKQQVIRQNLATR